MEERYSTQWNVWFPKELKKLGIETAMLRTEGTLRNTIRHGQFLDVLGTNHFKAAQLQDIMEMFNNGDVEDGDVFLFADLWFPGLEMLQYVRDAMGLDGPRFKIAGCLHAGTWDPHDFLSQRHMGEWAEGLEEAWFKIADVIFVATQFHKRLLLKNREVLPTKVKVTGFPLFEDEVRGKPKEKKEGIGIVFPHRIAPEKGSGAFYALEKQMKNDKEGFWFLRTKDEWTTKKAYYDQLAAADFAVSFAKQETWGIAMQEAIINGCIPIVPDYLSYKELFMPQFRYNVPRSEAELPEVWAEAAKEKIEGILGSNIAWYRELAWKNTRALLLNSFMAIPKMALEMYLL